MGDFYSDAHTFSLYSIMRLTFASVTAAAFTAVAVAAFAGLAGSPQGSNGQCRNGNQYGDHNDVSNDRGHDRALLSGLGQFAAATELNCRRERPAP